LPGVFFFVEAYCLPPPSPPFFFFYVPFDLVAFAGGRLPFNSLFKLGPGPRLADLVDFELRSSMGSHGGGGPSRSPIFLAARAPRKESLAPDVPSCRCHQSSPSLPDASADAPVVRQAPGTTLFSNGDFLPHIGSTSFCAQLGLTPNLTDLAPPCKTTRAASPYQVFTAREH